MKREIPMIYGDEYDALTRWRHSRFWRPGERKQIKKKFNRRERQYHKDVVKTEYQEYKKCTM